jgi:hypothetical protein
MVYQTIVLPNGLYSAIHIKKLWWKIGSHIVIQDSLLKWSVVHVPKEVNYKEKSVFILIKCVRILELAFPISWMIFTFEINWLSLIFNYNVKMAHHDEIIITTIVPAAKITLNNSFVLLCQLASFPKNLRIFYSCLVSFLIPLRACF